jgi:hypothetical protein
VHYIQYRNRLFLYLFIVILSLSGCTEQIKQPTRICPGKKTANEALSALGSHSAKTVPLKANGQCRLEYYAEGKSKKENFPMKLWVNPVRNSRQQGEDGVHIVSNRVNPLSEIYLQGDVAFDPRGLVLGSNEDEFWLAIRLKEISSYWLGRWTEVGSVEGLLLDPRVVLEALGIMAVNSDVEDAENWTLSKEGAFDILTKNSGRAGIIKKIFIYNCDYSVRKIQYLDIDEKSELVVELDKYKQVVEDFSTPSIIRISRHSKNIEDQAKILLSLTSIKPTSISSKQRNVLFNPPKTTGFKHFFVNIDGKWIER